MADISQITLPSGTTYNLKDQGARDLIATIESYSKYLGVTTTQLIDGATTNPITINSKSVTAKNGDIANYGSKEFIFNGTSWQEFGDLSALGDLAYKNSATGSYTPAGSVSQPTFTGSSTTSSGKFTPSGTVTVSTKSTSNKTAAVSPATSGTTTYTPEGTNSGCAVSLNTTTVNSITDVGSLPTFTVANEVLTISAGTLPTKGSNVTVATSVKSVTQPTFEGTGVRLVTGNIAVPSAYTATFSGTEDDVSVSGTPSGTVSKPTFSGSAKDVTVS